ncbi:NUDIX hydrolase [Streptomyces caniscabiei]|uniref:NUDIX hydrolase n=1 Tax=Streptomyces caniscabiei TaxID=2746961 RepID=UPI0029B44DA0|nr:NUDIX hydrolase [Streptomyces caniscabiei]MDX2776679.1 NUDIX hydrolase [Streptomyces caniscabiei]
MMRAYYALGAAISPAAVWLFRLYNRLFKTVRPRVLIVTETGELLLVRNWTGNQGWELPGGGKGRHESPERAVLREIKEELGIELSTYRLEYAGTIAADGYEAPVFKATVKERLPITRQKWELSAAVWRHVSSLPEELGPVARRVFENDVQNTRDLI